MKICKIEGCTNNGRITRGMCNSHYQRWLRHGDPLAGGKRFNTPEESFAARTEWQGDCLIWTGGLNAYGYGVIIVERKSVGAHRYAWEREHGPIPEGYRVDHKDHCDTRCVNVKHLRLATHQQNLWNLNGANKNNLSSGELNIYPHQGKWRVRISNLDFGSYADIEDAKIARNDARKKLYGEFAGTGV